MTAPSVRAHVLVRPAMRPDEWPETYLASLARAQGLRRPWGHDVDLVRSVLPWEPPRAIEAPRDREARLQYLPGRPQYGAMPLPPWASVVRAMPLRYCPHCLAERRYFRTRWRFSGLHACTTHGCFLKANLADQALTANYTRKGLLQFKDATNEQILDGTVMCLPREAIAISMVWRPLELMSEQSVSPREDEALGQTAAWAVLLWRFLEEISRAHHKKVIRQPTTGQLAGVARLIDEFGLAVSPCRDGMLALLAALRENTHVLAAHRFLERLIFHEDQQRTALSALNLVSLRERLASFAPAVLSRTPHGEMAFREIREHAINKASLIEDLAPLGGSWEIVNRWIQRKLIPTKKVSREGMDFTFIERKDALQVRRALLSLIHARNFTTEHDLDWPTYKAIRDTGLIRTGALGLRGYLYRKDVAVLIGKLELMSAPEPKTSVMLWKVFCASTLYIAEQRATFADLIRAATEGRFHIYRNLSKPGLSAFSIGVDGIAWLAGRRKAFFYERKRKATLLQPGLFDGQMEEAPA